MKSSILCMTILAALGSGAASAMTSSKVDFSHGLQGWYGNGAGSDINSGIDSMLGNGTPSFHVVGPSSDFSLNTFTNADFIGDYTAMKSFTFGFDITVAELAIAGSGGTPVAQDVVLEFRDYDKPSSQMPYSSVWYNLGLIGAGQPASQHLSVTVGDTSSNLLPSGWNGYGDYGPDGQLQLPYAQTFRRILSDVDQVVITTAVPGYVYGAAQYYNLSLDNITISAVPEPSTVGMLLAGLGVVGWSAQWTRRRGMTG